MGQEKDFTYAILAIYDAATKLANREGKDHREVFEAMCRLVQVTADLQEQKINLAKVIDELTATQVILAAIKQDKVGKG